MSDLWLQGGCIEPDLSHVRLVIAARGAVSLISHMSDLWLQGGMQQLTSHMVQVIGKKNIKLNQAVSHIVQVGQILESLVWYHRLCATNCPNQHLCTNHKMQWEAYGEEACILSITQQGSVEPGVLLKRTRFWKSTITLRVDDTHSITLTPNVVVMSLNKSTFDGQVYTYGKAANGWHLWEKLQTATLSNLVAHMGKEWEIPAQTYMVKLQ